MININIKGLLVDADFLMNYKSYNLSGEEAMFLLQISYLTNQGDLPFSIDLFTDQSNKSENEIFSMLDNLVNKGYIVISTESKLNFIIFNKKEDYYTLRELLKLTERVTGRILTSKEIDIVTSWFEKMIETAVREDAEDFTAQVYPDTNSRVLKLKKAIFKAYLDQTKDFRTSIFGGK